jgi:hypothetical protein
MPAISHRVWDTARVGMHMSNSDKRRLEWTPKDSPTRLGLGWMVLATGAVVVAAGLVAFVAPAPGAGSERWWLVVSVAAAIVLLTLHWQDLVRREDEATAKRDLQRSLPGGSHVRALPLLGEVLLYRYHLVSERDLLAALVAQRKRGGALGQILVEMGAITSEQLSRALEDQLSYGDAWRGSALSRRQPARRQEADAPPLVSPEVRVGQPVAHDRQAVSP